MDTTNPLTRTWLDTVEAARFLGAAKDTLLTWRQRGRGPRFHKIGRRVRYDVRDLEAFIAAGAVGASPAGHADRVTGKAA